MKTFSELFKIILTGDKESGRKAAREVRKLVYSSAAEGREKYDKIKTIIENAPEEYRKITEDFRQEHFVMAISVMYFLHDREQEPDFLFPWLFHLLKHKNGNIRHCAVKMLCHELGPLTVHIRFLGERSKSTDLSPRQSDVILHDMYTGLEMLAREFYKTTYKRYKYIDSLPSGTYKSIQMVLARTAEYSANKA